jgi:hypothetical protein
MNSSFFSQKIYSFLLSAYCWYLKTPERSLEEAYQAALKIKEIEDQHFHGNKIDPQSALYSPSVMSYFQTDLQKLLKNARMRLTEFRFSRWFSNESKQKAAEKAGIEYPNLTSILEKLQFIDQVIAKYNHPDLDLTTSTVNASSLVNTPSDKVINQSSLPKPSVTDLNQKPKGKADTTGILPRSILSTITRLQVELNPDSEEEVVQDFRQTQRRTIVSIRFILILIIIPLLTHQVAKAVVVSPLVEHFRNPDSAKVFLNSEMEEEALLELERFEEKIKFENLISNAPPLSPEEIEEAMVEKAKDVAAEFRHQSANAVKNVFADMFSVVAFVWLLVKSKPSILVLKDFFDHLLYGLSDSAKAFIIILFTDIFVGFHSPHGWEVILEGISRHWGLPANRDFIFLFIATFPVILDTIFKYWIFRYLNRISPSAVATYHNMNK